jgi:hypothetical protein
MVHKFFPVLYFFFLLQFAYSQSRVIKNNSFSVGEKIQYRIHYGIIDAGTAQLEILENTKDIAQRPVLHCVGTGKSNKAFDLFFKVRDRYETFIDKESIEPIFFNRKIEEGPYKKTQNYFFNRNNNQVIANNQSKSIPAHVQDMLSSFYFMRTINFTDAKINEVFTIETYTDDELFNVKLRFVGRETIRTEFGNIKCLKFRPVLQKGRIFKNEEDLNVWVSDDNNKIPIRAQAEIMVGALKMDLQKFENTKTPLNFF